MYSIFFWKNWTSKYLIFQHSPLSFLLQQFHQQKVPRLTYVVYSHLQNCSTLKIQKHDIIAIIADKNLYSCKWPFSLHEFSWIIKRARLKLTTYFSITACSHYLLFRTSWHRIMEMCHVVVHISNKQRRLYTTRYWFSEQVNFLLQW